MNKILKCMLYNHVSSFCSTSMNTGIPILSKVKAAVNMLHKTVKSMYSVYFKIYAYWHVSSDALDARNENIWSVQTNDMNA